MNLESAGMNREELQKNNRAVAVQRVTGDFILKKIAEVEEIKVNDEDLERSFKKIGDQYNMSVAKVKEFFQNRDDLLPLMNEVLNEKVLKFLRDEATLIEPSADEEKEKKPAKKTAAKEPVEKTKAAAEPNEEESTKEVADEEAGKEE
jgi:trigger factor